MKTTKRTEKTKERKIKKFKNLCNIEQSELKKKLKNILLSSGYEKVVNEDGFLYAKGELPVLLVAHMDTVHKRLPEIIFTEHRGDKTVLSSPYGIGGDDRCGVFMILEIIKDLKCSVVFTEDEESGGIGAGKFVKTDYINDINVNYVIEFDRANANDAVFYYCDNEDFERFITEEYYETDTGSYSDICDIAPALGVAAVNLSCGYYRAHTVSEYVVFEEMMRSIEQAKKLIQKDVEEPFEYVEMVFDTKGYGYSYAGYTNDWYSGYYDDVDWYTGWKAKQNTYKTYYVVYYDENMVQKIVNIEAKNEDDATLSFLMNYQDIPYRNVIEVISEEELNSLSSL